MLSAPGPVPESASPGHSYTSAFGHQGHPSASSEPGNGWRTPGTSTCPKSKAPVPTMNMTSRRTAAGSNAERADTPGGEASSADPDGLQHTTGSQLLHCPLLIKPREEPKVALWDEGLGLHCLGVLEVAQWGAGGVWWVVGKVLLKLRVTETAWLENSLSLWALPAGQHKSYRSLCVPGLWEKL